MWPYVLLIILPMIVQHLNLRIGIYNLNKNKNRNAMMLFWLLMTLMLALRHETVGIDLQNYEIIFDTIAAGSWKQAMERSAEVGYSALCKLIAVWGGDFRWLLIVTAVLSVLFLRMSYLKYSYDTSLTIALFITMSNFILLFSGLRQSIAISIGFLAFECARSRRLILFLLVVILATLFHTSAFMLLFMYPLYHARITQKWLLVVVPAMGVLWVFNQQVFGFLTGILSQFTKYEGEISSTGAYTMLFLFIIFAVFCYLIPDESELDQDTIGMRNFLLLAVALQMFAPLHDLAMRMGYYYMAFIPLVVPRIIVHRRVRWNQVAIMARHVMILFFVIYFFMTAPQDNSLHTFPYHFFWETV